MPNYGEGSFRRMESRRNTIRNHRIHERKKVKEIWIDRCKSFFITCFCLGVIVFILSKF